MAKVNYLLNRNGIFYFRMPFPQELAEYLDKKECKFSLKTHNKHKALAICASLACKARLLCNTLINMKNDPYPISKELALKFFEERLTFYYQFIQDKNANLPSNSWQTGFSMQQITHAEKDFNQALLTSDYVKFEKTFKKFLGENGIDIPTEPESRLCLYELLLKGNLDAIIMANSLDAGVRDHVPDYPPFNEYRLVDNKAFKSVSEAPTEPSGASELIWANCQIYKAKRHTG